MNTDAIPFSSLFTRKKGTNSKQIESKQVSIESKAVPAPDANAELLASIQVRMIILAS